LSNVGPQRFDQGRERGHVGFDGGAVLEPVDELAAELALELLDPAFVFA